MINRKKISPFSWLPNDPTGNSIVTKTVTAIIRRRSMAPVVVECDLKTINPREFN